MTLSCELCGRTIPSLPLEELVRYGYREVVWEGKGPYRFCPEHTAADIVRWIAETLICDREVLRAMIETGGKIDL